VVSAQAEEAHGTAAETEGDIPSAPVQPIDRVIALINPILRGWVATLQWVMPVGALVCQRLVEKKVRRH